MAVNLRWIIAGVFLLKVILALNFPIVADEAYYYVWSLFPQLSYFDHPGMVSWLITLGNEIVPWNKILGLRIPFIILGTATMFFWLKIVSKTVSSNVFLIFFAILFSLNPLLGAGSILATPDVPLLFFWTVSYFCFLKIQSDGNLKWYALLGVFLGLGFCSKYHIVVFVMCGILYLGLTKEYKSLRIKGVLTTVFFGLIACLPVLVWNYQNEWSSFIFQLNHGFGRSYYKAEWSFSYIVGQFLIASPLVFIELFRRRSNDKKNQIFAWTQLGFFLSSTFKAVVEANWPLTSHPHALAHFINRVERKKVFWTISYWIVIYISLISIFVVPATRPLIKSQWTFSDFEDVAMKVKDLHPLYGPTYQVSSLISFINGKLTPKLRGVSRRDFFDELEVSEPQKGTFYVIKEIDASLPGRFANSPQLKLESFDKLGLELYQVNYD